MNRMEVENDRPYNLDHLIDNDNSQCCRMFVLVLLVRDQFGWNVSNSYRHLNLVRPNLHHGPHSDADDVHVQHRQPAVKEIYSLK